MAEKGRNVSGKVDVLAVIRKVSTFNGGYIADDLSKVEAALAELIAADKEYDEAERQRFDDLQGVERFDAARTRRAAALAALEAP